jgi:myb proto-oncogene protein
VDAGTHPAASVFNPPFRAPEDLPRPASAAGYVSSAAAGISSYNNDESAAGITAATATGGDGGGAVLAASESVAPSPTSTASACTDTAQAGGCDDGFLKAMVDDASFLFGDFYLDGGNHDGSIGFWGGHAFS